MVICRAIDFIDIDGSPQVQQPHTIEPTEQMRDATGVVIHEADYDQQ